MRCPSYRRGDDYSDNRLGRDRTHQQPQARHVLVGRQQTEKLLEGEEHQPEPDRHAAEVARPAGEAAAKQDEAAQHK